jgi:ribosome biogenesis GTPase
MKGVVIKSTGSLCQVLSENKEIYSCKIKGKTRLMNIEFTNPIAVGDNVEFSFDVKNQMGLINKIARRKNYIIRKSVNLSHKSQVIASNIDLALLVITISDPITSLNFIDRFLVQSQAYDIEAKLIFNKTDLYNQKLKKKKEEYQKLYESIGYETISTSIKTQENISKIKNLLLNKVTVFSGHSGAGKSSLINLIEPDLCLKTQDISESNRQGVHTTTYAEMFPFSFGGYIIDTPGIKGLGLIDVDMNTLSRYFPEMFRESQNCKFKNCIHLNEPHCSVLTALKKGMISKSRYKNYLSMLETNTNYRQTNYNI